MKTSLLSFRCLAALTFTMTTAELAHAAGGPGYALWFNDTADSISVPHAGALNAYPLTVTVWVQATLIPPNSASINVVSKYGSINGWQFSLYAGNLYAAYYANGANFVPQLDGGPVADGAWHHLAFTVDANGGRLYVDGMLQASNGWTGTASPATTTENMSLGGFAGPLRDQSVTLDEVTVWNVALSQTQIQANKNRSLTGNEVGLVAYYRCDEGTGSTIADSAAAGGSNNGSLNGPFFVGSGVLPFTPFVETLSADAIGVTNATLNGVANPEGTNTTAWFEWGTTTNYGNLTLAQALGAGTVNTNFNQVVTGLVGGLTYNYRAIASNMFGMVSGTNQSFTLPAFTLDTNVSHAPVGWGSDTWADFNNDGRLDFFRSWTIPDFGVRVLVNTGSGFTNGALPGAPGLITWTDFDNDGRPDYLVTGLRFSLPTLLYKNTGAGFLETLDGAFPEMSSSATAWADFDNDGRPDVFFITGWGNSVPVTHQLQRNVGDAIFAARPITGLARVVDGAVAWADFDNDGWSDFLLTGMTNTFPELGISQLWRNTGSGFTQVTIVGLPDVMLSSVAWADYDTDGRPDFFVTGFNINEGRLVSQLWRNTGSGFTNVPLPGVPGVYRGAMAWADYDGDGRPDFLLTGATNYFEVGVNLVSPISQLWRNTGSGFTNVPVPGLTGVCLSSIAWGDYDGDGRPDFSIMGSMNGSEWDLLSQLWKNRAGATNAPPGAPPSLSSSVVGSFVLLSWGAAMDDHTPAEGLTYNVRIGTTPGGVDALSPLSLANGTRLVVQYGNAAQRRFMVFRPEPGKTYFWSVQSVDGAYLGSPFAPEQILTTAIVSTPTNGIPIPGDTNADGIVSQSELDAVLSNYFPNSPFLQMTNVAGLGGTNVSFTLSNSTAGAFSVEVTTNLMDWQLLGPATPRYEFTDTNAPAVPQRYYRLRWP